LFVYLESTFPCSLRCLFGCGRSGLGLIPNPRVFTDFVNTPGAKNVFSRENLRKKRFSGAKKRFSTVFNTMPLRLKEEPLVAQLRTFRQVRVWSLRLCHDRFVNTMR
jgi:hypothetical protein